VGAYTITPSGLRSANYRFTYESGTLQILSKRLIVKAAEDQFKFFREVDPEFAYEVSGFERNDDLAVMTGNLARESGEAVGHYPFTLGSLAAGSNYNIHFISSTYEIKTTFLAEIIKPLDHEIAWGTTLNDFGLPSSVLVMTENGDFISIDVIWESGPIDRFKRGRYGISGSLVLKDGIVNPDGLTAIMSVIILPKPAPDGFFLDNAVFDANIQAHFLPIGRFLVEDQTDNVHFIGLFDDAYDNKYFEIKDNILYWNSADRAEGNRLFTILVKVTDREGNELVKTFEITRNRLSVESIEVYNTFTPNGDGSNDTWGVPDLQFYSGGRVMVFERSGNRVFYTENPSERWDGTFRGKELPVGSYFWVIESGETGEVRRGILNLIRK
jgi:gliding motility-associated-like protein